ncbi:ABC transporter ATP-binding protein [Amycolatopsis anabasis]|uniref:ABC transporter ATP-binding protein n=1 Tax=Amycolatopsis anabasis TaxID=1840409 RepID=UPI00131E9578|nr:ABC transporter ATP-binding protein [Amycolatopsis anabasis]
MPETALSTRDLSVGYHVRGGTKTVLSGLELSLRPGELVCLLGVNGVGKSTLLRTLAGLQSPVSGAVELLGTPLSRMSRRRRARALAVVLTSRIGLGTIRGRDLVAMGRAPYTGWAGRLTESDDQVVTEALRRTGSAELAHRPLDELSDGERQRLMVARALAQQPSVILLDEPTAFLDAPRRAELTAMLGGLCREAGIAALLSTHDIELALRSADRIWLVTPSGAVLAAAPENLVLSGALREAFSGPGFDFDPMSGGYSLAT